MRANIHSAHEPVSKFSREDLDTILAGKCPESFEGKRRTAYRVTKALLGRKGPLEKELWDESVKVSICFVGTRKLADRAIGIWKGWVDLFGSLHWVLRLHCDFVKRIRCWCTRIARNSGANSYQQIMGSLDRLSSAVPLILCSKTC